MFVNYSYKAISLQFLKIFFMKEHNFFKKNYYILQNIFEKNFIGNHFLIYKTKAKNH